MKHRVTAIVASVCIVVVAMTAAMRLSPLDAAEQHHTTIGPDAMKWSPAGTGLSIAVLSGTPDKEGAPFVIRLKLATGTRIPPHWHPVDEHLTVVSGTFYMGTGEQFDESNAAALIAGTYAMMPKEVRHFGWTGVDTVVQIHGVGPFKTYFVEQPVK